jgi:hypothetical protein
MKLSSKSLPNGLRLDVSKDCFRFEAEEEQPQGLRQLDFGT